MVVCLLELTCGKSLGVLTWNVAVGAFPVSDRLGIHSLAVISNA